MRKRCWLLVAALSFGVKLLSADTIILKNGSRYSGDFGARVIAFTDLQGIHYEFLVKDVQSLSLNPPTDTVVFAKRKKLFGALR